MPRVRERRGSTGRPVDRPGVSGGLHGVPEGQRHRGHEHHEGPRLPGGAQPAGDHGRRVAQVRAQRVPKRGDRRQAEERATRSRDC